MTILFYLTLGKLFLKDYSSKSFFKQLFFGILISSFLALTFNFFLPLNKYLNSLIQLTIIIIYFFISRLSIQDLKKIFVITILSILIIIFDTVNRPDAFLYHLPYSQILNENKIIFGLSNLHSRFGHVSVMQYLSAFNFTVFSGQSGLLSPLAIYWGFITYYFINEVLGYFQTKNLKLDVPKLFSIFVLIYIFLRINRYGEFGNDAPAHLTIFFLISNFLKIKENINENYFKYILSISIFAVLNKFFLIFSLILPGFIFFKLKKIKPLMSFPSLLIFLWFLKNILISGCIIYPVSISCFEKILWSDIKDTKLRQISGEAWSKGWPDRKNTNITQEKFVKNFNWVESWIIKNPKIYFKNIFPFLMLILILILILKRKQINHLKINKNLLYMCLLFSIIGSLVFILKFPIFRYGYSFIITFIIILTIFLIGRINDEEKKILKLTLSFVFIIFCLKNIQRIYKYKNDRDLIPLVSITNNKSLYQEKKINNFKYYVVSNFECGYFLSPCINEDRSQKLRFFKLHNYQVIAKN